MKPDDKKPDGKKPVDPEAPKSSSDLVKKEKKWIFQSVLYLDLSDDNDQKEYADIKNRHREGEIKIEWEERKWVTSPLETTFYACIFYSEGHWFDKKVDKMKELEEESGEAGDVLDSFRAGIQSDIDKTIEQAREQDVDGEIDSDTIRLHGFEEKGVPEK